MWELPVRMHSSQVLLGVHRAVDRSFPSLPRAEKVDRTHVQNQILPSGELLAYIHPFTHSFIHSLTPVVDENYLSSLQSRAGHANPGPWVLP